MNMDRLSKGIQHCSLTSQSQKCDSNSSAIVLGCGLNRHLAKWPKAKQRVPDILLHKVVDFAQHVKAILEQGIKIYQPYLGTNYTKICPFSYDDFVAILQYFDEHELPYHTFGLPESKQMRVVMKGLPKGVDLEKLVEILVSVEIPVTRVHKMGLKDFAKDQDPLILVVVPCNDKGKKILRVKQIMGHDVELEQPIKKTKQCFRCLKWGHAQRYCHGRIKCVKCAGDHYSKNCSRDPNSTEPPTCANCGGNHTASYRECFYCPDSEEYKQNKAKKIKNQTSKPQSKRELVTWENCERNLYKTITHIPKHTEAIPF